MSTFLSIFLIVGLIGVLVLDISSFFVAWAKKDVCGIVGWGLLATWMGLALFWR